MTPKLPESLEKLRDEKGGELLANKECCCDPAHFLYGDPCPYRDNAYDFKAGFDACYVALSTRIAELEAALKDIYDGKYKYYELDEPSYYEFIRQTFPELTADRAIYKEQL